MRATVLRGGRRPGRGVPLWVSLTALVMAPLVGVVTLTAVVVQDRVREAGSAARAEAAVVALAQLDTARSGVEQEILPTLALAVIDDPVTARALGLPPALLAEERQQTIETQAVAREMTDQALYLAGRSRYGADASADARARVAAVRHRADARGVPLDGLYLEYLAISTELVRAQRAAASAASSEGVAADTQRAIQDVELVAQLATTASRQIPLFLGALFSGADGDAGLMIGSRLAWETGALAYADALDQMSRLSRPQLRERWQAVRSSDVMTALDAVTAPSDEGAAALPLTVPQLVPLLLQSAARDAMLSSLVDTAASSAQTSAAADRDEATSRRTTTLLLALGVLLTALVVALWLGRTVTRSLRLLAGQAGQVSEGCLVHVEVGGPREVRTVSSALSAAVASLRRIQDQARAVARGDLDNALLDQPLPGPLGEVVHASVRQIVSSVRQREELQTALAHQAAHDALTELPNRTQALGLTGSALFRGRRAGSMTGLLHVDLDGFKAVNDSHGHACGDEVLREVAGRLRDAIRAGDVVCRLGGDEFIVLVEPVETEHDLVELAQRLIAGVGEPIPAGGDQIRIGASIGIAVSRDGTTDADVLFAEADAATRRAKANGQGRAEVFDDALRAQLAARAELEAAIAAALAAGEVQLHYQPVIDVPTDRVVGFEALVRWERPGHGMVHPDAFIPVAEASRLIFELDRWALLEATCQLAEWRCAAGAAAEEWELTVAVNVSGRHLTDRRVVQDVAEALAVSGLPAHLLVLEVTETVLVDDPMAIDHLAELRAMGVAVAIDDFGTGYTSIGQLRHLPVDTLKIDRSFVASTDPGQGELVALMIRAAHTFGLTVVAEGVEDPEQLARLRADGCDQAQGYLFHRPLPAAEAGALLQPRLATGGALGTAQA